MPRPFTILRRSTAWLLVAAGLSGCGAAAAPCRVGSAALKVIPVIGHPLAAPTDACAGAIDPDATP